VIFNVLIHDGDLSCAGRREGMADRVCKIAANHQEKGEDKFFYLLVFITSPPKVMGDYVFAGDGM